MEGERLERWQHLAARVAEEQDPAIFSQLVKELLGLTVELESKFVPLIVNVWAVDPDATKPGAIPLIVGTGWFGGGGGGEEIP